MSHARRARLSIAPFWFWPMIGAMWLIGMMTATATRVALYVDLGSMYWAVAFLAVASSAVMLALALLAFFAPKKYPTMAQFGMAAVLGYLVMQGIHSLM